MNEQLPPLPDDVTALIRRAAVPAPPPGFADQVFGRLNLEGLGTAAVSGLAGVKLAVALATAVAVGAGAGVAIDRLLVAVPVAPIVIVKTVTVEVPVPAPAPEQVAPPPAAAPAAKPRPPAPAPAVKPGEPTDAQLREERSLLEVSRTALARGDAAGALAGLEAHARKFKSGRLAEEREALLVTALAMLGRSDEAKAKAKAFEEAWPDSLLTPQVRRAVATPR